MGSQDERKAKQALRMKRDWDLRAAQDATHFIVSSPQPWTLAQFFEHGRQQAHTMTRDSFRELAFEPTGKRMLEIGCGIGRLFPGFIEMFAEVWGVDVSEEMIKQGSKLHVSPNVRLIQNSGYDLAGMLDNYFDFVFSYVTFQHVPQRWMIFNYLAETYRVLRPSGAFQLHFRQNRMILSRLIWRFVPHPLRRPAQILKRLLLLYPLRHLSLQAPCYPGDSASWLGTSFSPTEIEGELVRLGFVEVKSLADETHPRGTRFWTIGRKPGHEV